jgi:hypothetical protein
VSESADAASAGRAAGQTDPLYVRGVVLVLLAGSFWSLGGLFVRLIEGADAWQIILYRSSGAPSRVPAGTGSPPEHPLPPASSASCSPCT